MIELTDGNHDELWFWLVSTLNNIPCIGLDYTYSNSIDDGVCLAPTETDLTNINKDQKTIDRYNRRLNEIYGKDLRSILLENPVRFSISHDSILKFTGNIKLINHLYGNFPIILECDDTIVASWVKYLAFIVNSYKWRTLKIKLSKEN